MSLRRLFVQLFSIAICMLSNIALAENTAGAAISCHDHYEQLNNQHVQTMSAKAMISEQLYLEGLWEIEDKMFVALQQCPTDALLFSLMAELQMTLGQAPFAVVYARKAVNLNASLWQAYYALGTALCMVGDCPTGIDYLHYANKLEPDNPRLQLNLCSAFAWTGQHELVIKTCSTLIDSDSKDVLAQAYYLRSQANKALGHRHEAEQDIQEAERRGFNTKRDVLQVIAPDSVPPSLRR